MGGGLPSTLGSRLGRQLKERELERRKAQTLQFSWKLEQLSLEASKELEATRPSLRAKPEGPEKEAKAPAHEEKEVSGPHLGGGGPGWSDPKAGLLRDASWLEAGFWPGSATPQSSHSCVTWAGDILLRGVDGPRKGHSWRG